MPPNNHALATAEEMRACDQYTIQTLGISGAVLMESAGRGAAALLLDWIASSDARRPHETHIAVFCGGGNNGGDGYVIARELLHHGLHVRVVVLAARASIRGESLQNLIVLERLIHELGAEGDGQIHFWGDALSDEAATIGSLLARTGQPDVIVDALLGTGLSSEVRTPYREAIEWINASPAEVFSVDIPSGLHANTGKPLPVAVRADQTATLALAKVGLFLHPGRSYCGVLHIVDIGIPPRVQEICGVRSFALHDTWVTHNLPPRPSSGHKGTFGHCVVLGGSQGKAGALILCARAALRAGAGLVTAVGSEDSVRALNASQPEAMTEHLTSWFNAADDLDALSQLLSTRDAVAIGPGLGTCAKAQNLLAALLCVIQRPLVLDADALNIIAMSPKHTRLLAEAASRIPIILTPHPGELGRLTSKETREAAQDLRSVAGQLASSTGCIVVAKSSTTLILHPDERLAVNTTGNDGMATGGSGDVLTGMIVSLLGQGVDPWSAACAAVFLHGRAGDIASQSLGRHTLLAGDILLSFKDAFASCPPHTSHP